MIEYGTHAGGREGAAALWRVVGPPMATQRVEKLRDEVEEISALPTLPEIPMKILRVTAERESSMADIARIIETDPSLATNILIASNSPYYKVRSQVASLKLALAILGLNEIINIVTRIATIRMFPAGKKGIGFNRGKFWRHSFGTGCAAELLARELNFKLDGVEFVAGLIHDIGKLIIDQYFHPKLKEIQAIIEREEVTPIEAETRVLGVDHAVLASWLAQRWQLPAILVEAIEHHHRPLDVLALSNPSHQPFLAAIVHLADILASEPEFGFTEESDSSQTFEENLAWKIILAERPDLNRKTVDALKSKYELYKERVNELVTAIS